MPITTIKRCQSDPSYWFTVEDCNVEVLDEPDSGLTIKTHGEHKEEGAILLSICKEDALLIRDAINQLYPPQ